MGADNWGTCPRCLRKADHEKVREAAETAQLYGQIPAEEYLAKLKNLGARTGRPVDQTLRKDFEIGTDVEGRFFVKYGARCTFDECGFTRGFNHHEKTNA